MTSLTRRASLVRLGQTGLVASAAMAVPGRWVQAQETWPARPISLTVPFPPGGVADTVGRPVAEALGRELGQPVVVENRAGAGGGVGMGQVAKASADGYRLLFALSSIVVLPEAARLLKQTPPFTLDELTPVARFTADPTVLVVRGDSPWTDFRQFLADARARPGAITFGSSGNYGTMHIPMEQLKAATKTYLLHVPYTGAGPALIGLMSGQVDALSTGPSSAVQHIRSGRLRALAHWGEGRLKALPDVPSLRELGVPVQYSQWAGLFAPAGTPAPVLDRLRKAAARVPNDARAKQAIDAAGTYFQYQDADVFTKFVRTEASEMAQLVKRIGRVD
jgi:tripartite-type tricarboxylate transporter receptor subunit TctC